MVYGDKNFIAFNEFARDIKNGLNKKIKTISPKYFYDKIGSELFELICIQPEYYLTRTEFKIIIKNIRSLTRFFGNENVSIIELGSGSSKKTKILLKYFLEKQNDELHYFPIDVSAEMLFNSTQKLSMDLPLIINHPIASDYLDGIKQANDYIANNGSIISQRKLVLFLGSSLGNLEPDEAVNFLSSIRDGLDSKDSILIGFDLIKKKEILEAAYNDSEGITARFNLNILNRINRELGGEFKLKSFEHRAYYDDIRNRIEMHIVSKNEQKIRIRDIDETFNFAENEMIHTENSYKYDYDIINDLTRKSDLKIERNFFDENRWFSLSLLTPK